MWETVKTWICSRKYLLLGILLILGALLFVLLRQYREGEQPLQPAVIGRMSQELSALADIKPDRLTYTESVSGRETCAVTITDSQEAKRILTILLNTPVSREGCHVDMALLRSVEYCFYFGSESYAFSFLPYSYFCYDGLDYELGANRLMELSVMMNEMAETKPE